MRPEASRFMEKAREDLDESRKIAAIGLAKVAARSAYYAAFHAAEAYIVEKTGRIAKSHSGVRNEFARLAKDDERITRRVVTFLPAGYRYKEIGDYGVGPDAVITMDEAEALTNEAVNFVACIEAALT